MIPRPLEYEVIHEKCIRNIDRVNQKETNHLEDGRKGELNIKTDLKEM
jgi:hypothetical protein